MATATSIAPEGIPNLWILVVLSALYVIFKILRFGSREKHLPPGPPTYPIVGNAHLLMDINLYRRFKDWSEQYGPVFSLKVGKGTIIVLNSKRAVHDLIDKRSAIYSARPQDDQFHNTMRNENIANMDANSVWRAQRKVTTRFFAPNKLDGALLKISEAEMTTLMHDLLVTPQDFRRHIERSTASFASITLFGQRANTHDDFWARGVYEAMEAINVAISPGTYLPTEHFPIVKLIPKSWLSSTARAEQGFNIPTRIWTEATRHVQARRDRGDKRESLLDELLDDERTMRDTSFHGTKLANFIGALQQGAAETTSLAMQTNVLFLAKHPSVQEKAQRELDVVCGVERMPTFDDFEALPYINCIMKEGLRIRPVVPTGVPHGCTEDNWYEGMLIPKGASIMIPSWALSHSHEDDPETYNPDRFLNRPGLATEYAASPDFENRDHYAYGAGRRICAGMHLAERTQWRMLARLLWAFRIEPAIDESTGLESHIDTDAFEEKLLAGPKPFKVRFTPRSEKHVQIIKNELEAVSGLLKRWE